MVFSDVRVPITNGLGQGCERFVNPMKQLPPERLSIAVSSQTVGRSAPSPARAPPDLTIA